MKLLLAILMVFSLSSCDQMSDYMYENFSLQKNIDEANENERKNIEGDFKLDNFGYTFPLAIGRFVQNGFSYDASIKGEARDENIEILKPSQRADIYLKKDNNIIYVEATNTTGSDILIEDALIDYIEISSFELDSMDFSLGDINFGDALYEMSTKVPDKEIIELRQNSKDPQNDQYYMYLNGQYVALFTLYQGKLSQVEIIPNERLYQYETD